MVKLTKSEQDMLDGLSGRLKQKAIDNIVKYADVLDAESLCTVSMATLFCGRHAYLAAAGDLGFFEMFSKVQMSSHEIYDRLEISDECQCQTCVSPCETHEFAPFGQTEALFAENQLYLKYAQEAGIVLAGTCSPYLNGWLPIPGEHFVTTESGMTILGNSLWGACCNSDGIEAAFWSAICGRTPAWGRHTKAGRRGNILVRVSFTPSDGIEWDLLGKTIGCRLPTHSLPVVVGDFSNADFNKVRQFLTALASSSNCEMAHLVGLTPEAPTIEAAFQGDYRRFQVLAIDKKFLSETYDQVCDPGYGPVALVSLGCPHYDIAQVQKVAQLLKGRHVAPGVDLQIWTTISIKALADHNGFTKTIEQAGGHVYTSSCPTILNSNFMRHYDGMLFDSIKQNGSVRSSVSCSNYFGTTESCIAAALRGEWRREYRWV